MKLRVLLTMAILATGILSLASNPVVAEPSELPTDPTVKNNCVNPETRVGYYQYEHCKLHDAYNEMYNKVWKCSCGSGLCRPTEIQYVEATSLNPLGIEIKVDGKFYPVPSDKVRRSTRDMPRILLQYEAHVCATHSLTPNFIPTIECVWFRQVADLRRGVLNAAFFFFKLLQEFLLFKKVDGTFSSACGLVDGIISKTCTETNVRLDFNFGRQNEGGEQ